MLRFAALRRAVPSRVAACVREISGAASVTALNEYAERFAGVMPRRTLPDRNWPLPVVSFGLDDHGSSSPDRAGRFVAAITRKGCNLLVVDGDALLARSDEASDLFAAPGIDRDWEAMALEKLVAGGHVRREEVVIAVKLAAATWRTRGGRAYSSTPATLPSRLAAVSSALGVDVVDMLMVAIPESRAAFDAAALAGAAAAAQHLVAAGCVQTYGFSCSTWLAAAGAEGDAGGGAAAVAPEGQFVTDVVEAAAAAAAAVNGRTGLSFISYPASLASARKHYLPRGTDASTGKPLPSVPQAAHKHGLLQLLTHPLDCMVKVALHPNDVRAREAKAAAGQPVVPVEPRPLRCVASRPHADTHPQRTTELLNDSLNFAIHLELLWEKEVAATVEAFHTKAKRDAEAAAAARRQAEAAAASVAAPQPPAATSSAAGDSAECVRRAGPLVGLDPATTASLATGASLSRMGGYTTGEAIMGRTYDASDTTASAAGGASGTDALAAAATPSLREHDVHTARIIASYLGTPGGPFTLLHWQEIKNTRIIPAMSRLTAYVHRCPDASQWLQGYKTCLSNAMRNVETYVEQLHAVQAALLSTSLRRTFSELGAANAAFEPVHASCAPYADVTCPLDATEMGKVIAATGEPVTNDALRVLLSCPGSVAVTEVADAFNLRRSKRMRDVGSEEDAGALPATPVMSPRGGSNAIQPDSPAEAVLGAPPSELVLPPFRAVQKALAATVPQLLVDAASTRMPRWRDPLQGVPTQVELAPLQAALRRAQPPPAPGGKLPLA